MDVHTHLATIVHTAVYSSTPATVIVETRHGYIYTTVLNINTIAGYTATQSLCIAHLKTHIIIVKLPK